ncbi:Cytoplasmic 60S subunit biogenesis factor REI1 [Babesia sp. Xinjiang]|uniref:Cytoplasmic 60S subunit biogenesis factor REI1 n=1 Tax=Babesia sp. Xinjiang TaxID=462227 RepID=UPI000A230D7A|nr:Cytoplasmic 60S subunit biogenesis factor REI1 [Babesia sp. Xinjiang]ORM41798.1 Cytoplasmic 60S subunit biogenesis factor REI1 [Babesia sp. Xinjiang]
MAIAVKPTQGLCFLKNSVKAVAPPVDDTKKCVTCNALFSDVTSQKSHFKSEWHLYNVKRKGNGIPPVGHDDYMKLKEGLAQMMTIKNSALESKMKMHKYRKPRDTSHDVTIRVSVPSSHLDEHCDAHAAQNGVTAVPYDPVCCLFSGRRASSVEENLKCMAKAYSFFIPEKEYVISVEGLLCYLHDKIYNQNICIYCQRQFRSTYAVLHHMEQKQHRKVNDDDLEELGQFYDFTSSYAELIPTAAIADNDSAITSDDDEWEDVITTKTDCKDALQSLACYGLSRARINGYGNLTLPNGREAIHRDVSYVYKQNLALRNGYGMSKAPSGFRFLSNSYKKHIVQAEKQKRTKLEHMTLKMQYKSYKLFVPCNQIAYAT